MNRKLKAGNMKAVQTCEVETPLALHSIGHIFYSDRSLMIKQSHEVTFLRKKGK